MELTEVVTPPNIFQDQDQRTIKAIGVELTNEMHTHKGWSLRCTEIMTHSAKCMYLYDRLEVGMGKAYGNPLFKILLNPCFVLCYHPDCSTSTNAAPVKLRTPFNITEFIQHIQRHVDQIGYSMQLRFQAVFDNLFITEEELDALAISPFRLQPDMKLSDQAVVVIESYGIVRDLTTHYICHWKDRLLSEKVIDSSSLSFQEDDALVYSVLMYPHPIPNWSVWQTIYLYALKLYTAVGGTALALYRGETKNRLTNKGTMSASTVKKYAGDINHAAPSNTAIHRFLPGLNYGNKVYHPTELLSHMKVLQSSPSSFVVNISPEKIIYPVTIGIDEQEINQGTFIYEGYLYGLSERMSASDIKAIGLNNLAKHISTKNQFNICVREYRVHDFAGLFSSNAYTSFESHALTGDQIRVHLDPIINYVSSCQNCLFNKQKCEYDRIDEQCQRCILNGLVCTCVNVFHVLWDMGSGQKKMEKDYGGLEVDSTDNEMMSRKNFTLGFGGLHICKALVNVTRNWVIQFDKQHFGVNILIGVRRLCPLLQLVKMAVFVGKDRQSDLLAYLTVCPDVQEALKKLGCYTIQRVPEKFLPYKAKAQKNKIIFPVDICSNRNGIIFILDAGAACLHVIDRAAIANITVVGSYSKPSLASYVGTNELSNVNFSNNLGDMTIDEEDNIYILDSGRQEICVLRNFVGAKSKGLFQVLKIDALSIVYADSLMLLKKDDSSSVLQKLSFDLPSRQSASKQVHLKFKILMSVVVSAEFSLKKLFYFPLSKWVGGMEEDGSLVLMKLKSKTSPSTTRLRTISQVKPHTSEDKVLVTFSNNQVHLTQISFHGDNIDEHHLQQQQCDDHATSLFVNGSITSVIVLRANHYVLLELGKLDFAQKYCSAICQLYGAIGYVPPRGDKVARRTKTLPECIREAEPSSKLLNQMQSMKESSYPTRTTFYGPDGMPASDTIHCLDITIESWKANLERLERLGQYSTTVPSADHLYTPALTNESTVEHAFGYTKKRGQGHNQNQQEYINSKRLHSVNFILRMCRMPFNQKIKEKLQDKGYQDLHGNRCSMSLKDLKEIFMYNEVEQVVDDVSEDDMNLLKKANLISGTVPRQSNRTKCREKSGYQPNMLLDHCVSGTLYKTDLVCSRSITDEPLFLIVEKDTPLVDLDVMIPVSSVADGSKFNVKYDKLLQVNGQVFTVPMQLYTIVDREVEISELLHDSLAVLENSLQGSHSLEDDEWALLLEEDLEIGEEEVLNEGANEAANEAANEVAPTWKRNRAVESSSAPKKKRKSDEGPSNMLMENAPADTVPVSALPKPVYVPLDFTQVDKGDWVLVQYQGRDYLGKVVANSSEHCRVQCLTEPYGYRLAQEFEKECDALDYTSIYEAPICPWPSELDDNGKRTRKTYYKY